MSAKDKKPAPPNKKASNITFSKALTEPALPIPDQDRGNQRSKALPKELLVEYDYLCIQAADSFSLIEAITSNSTEAVRSILREKLTPNLFEYSVAHANHTSEDVESLKEIYAAIMTDVSDFGFRFGFRPYQLSIWLTIYVKILIETIAQVKTNTQFQISEYKGIINRTFLHFALLQEPSYGRIPLFTTSEYKEMLDYLVRGFIMHSNLFKFVLLSPQEHFIYREKRRFEFALPAEPMVNAINELDWPNHCKELEEKALKEQQDIINLENARIQAEIDKAEKDATEKHTLSLKTKLADAEKAMLTPLPPYPIPPPQMPTMEQIFRKQIITKAEVPATPADEEKNQTPPPSPPSSAKGGKNSKKKVQSASRKKDSSNNLASLQNTAVIPRPRVLRDLLPPPDMSISKPLEQIKLSTPEPVVESLAPIVAPIITTIEFVDIPLCQPLTRSEASEIVVTSVSSAVEEYKRWVQQMMQWEETQWAERLAQLQKARADRDADLATHKAKAQAGKLAPEPKKGKK